MQLSSSESVTEVVHTSWFSRMKSALAGIVTGLVLLVAAFVLLFWNEGRAVKTARSLDEGAALVRPVDAARIDPGNQDALVHVTGQAVTGEILEDPVFSIAIKGLRLERTVQMWQWRESKKSRTEKQTGGGTKTVTTYSYATTWSEPLIGSSQFKSPDGHRNPTSKRFAGQVLSSKRVQAKDVRLGAFRLSGSQIGQIGGGVALELDEAFMSRLAAPMDSAVPLAGWMYLNGRSGEPRVGDLRVRFQVIAPTTVSVVAMQSGESLTPYQTTAGRGIEMVETGAVPAQQMFQQARTGNTLLTWGLRLGGMLAMLIGLALILAPLSVMADVIPAIGNVVGVGTGLVAALLATGLSVITIAVAWVVYRPLLGGGLLLAGIGLFVLPRLLARNRPPAGSQAPPVPPPAGSEAPQAPPPAPPPAGSEPPQAPPPAPQRIGNPSVSAARPPPPPLPGIPQATQHDAPLPGVDALLAHAMIAGAAAGGAIGDEQMARITRQARKAGITDASDRRLLSALDSPWSVERLAAACSDRAGATRVYGAAVFASDADIPGVRGFLSRLAEGLELPSDTVAAVHRKLRK